MNQSGDEDKTPLYSALHQLHTESRELWVPNTIPEYSSPTESIHFLREHVSPSIPCVWRGMANAWTALKKWPANDFQYLKSKVGHKQVDVTCTPNGYADALVDIQPIDLSSQPDCFNNEKNVNKQVFARPLVERMQFDKMLKKLQENKSKTKSICHQNGDIILDIPYYSAQNSNLTTDVPELLQKDQPEMKKDINSQTIAFAKNAFGENASAINLWVGDERSVSSMHADPFENIYAVITGCKKFDLLPPCDAAFIKKPALPNARWQHVVNGKENHDALNIVLQYPGWELVPEDGFTTWVDETSVIRQHLSPVNVILYPGDVLYLPALWCKYLSSLFLLFVDIDLHCY